MRLLKKGGSSPRGRRLGRAKVALAALAALVLCATTAQADTFHVNQSLSYLYHQSQYTGPALGGTMNSVAQDFAGPGGGSWSAWGGQIDATVSGGAITLNSVGSSLWATGLKGPYAPLDLGTSNPGVGVQMANYGVQALAMGYYENLTNIEMTFGAQHIFGVVPTPSALSGGTSGSFDLAGNGMSLVGTTGRYAFVSGLGNDAGDFMQGDGFGFPFLFGTLKGVPNDPYGLPGGTLGTANIPAPGIDVGTLSLDGQTLTIPIHFATSYQITAQFGGINTTNEWYGVIVATIPEPSSMVLAGFGIVGLMSCALRARQKRQA